MKQREYFFVCKEILNFLLKEKKETIHEGTTIPLIPQS